MKFAPLQTQDVPMPDSNPSEISPDELHDDDMVFEFIPREETECLFRCFSQEKSLRSLPLPIINSVSL